MCHPGECSTFKKDQCKRFQCNLCPTPLYHRTSAHSFLQEQPATSQSNINFSDIMECSNLISEVSEPCTSGDSTLTVQVANDSNIVIPIHFTTSSIHLSSVQKFKFPIRPPEPNHVQDKRSTLHIFQDMLGILNDTPKLNFKFYLD